MILWTSTDAAIATNGQTGQWNASGISIDTRTIKPGDLFVALRGPNADGHDYVAQALEKGAAAVMVDHVPEGISKDKCLVVPDTLKGLEDLARAARVRTGAKIIAVTGSVGKTGTKNMLELVFGAQAKTHASQKSYNNHWGVPLTLALMPPETEVGIFEIGMNAPNEIAPLSKMVRPDIAIITTVEAVHIESFTDGETGIANAKAEIFEGFLPFPSLHGSSVQSMDYPDKPGNDVDHKRYALLNQDNRWFNHVSEIAEAKGGFVYAFGENAAAASFSELNITPGQTSFLAHIMGEDIPVTLCVSGVHHAMNTLPVLLSVKLLGYDPLKAAQSLSTWQQADGRGRQEKIYIQEDAPPIILLDEHYNASPVAMRAAFAALGRITPEGQGRKIVVLGDMAELGEDAAKYHTDLAPDLCATGAQRVYAAGPNMKHLFDILPDAIRTLHTDMPYEMCAALKSDLRPGDVVLIKGSRGGAEKPKMLCLVEAVKGLE